MKFCVFCVQYLLSCSWILYLIFYLVSFRYLIIFSVYAELLNTTYFLTLSTKDVSSSACQYCLHKVTTSCSFWSDIECFLSGNQIQYIQKLFNFNLDTNGKGILCVQCEYNQFSPTVVSIELRIEMYDKKQSFLLASYEI